MSESELELEARAFAWASRDGRNVPIELPDGRVMTAEDVAEALDDSEVFAAIGGNVEDVRRALINKFKAVA